MSKERQDKQYRVMSMFSKIAKEEKRKEEWLRKQAHKNGEFYHIENPDTLPIKERIRYYKELSEWEKSNILENRTYYQTDSDFPFPYKFM